MGQSALIEVIIQRDGCSTLGLESKVMAVRYSVSSANILCGIVVSFVCFSFLSFILLHCPPLLLFHTWRTAPKSYRWLCLQSALSQMSLILWMLWCIPPLLPILQGNLPPHPSPSLACIPVVPVGPRAPVHPAGMAKETGTAGILDHPDYKPLTIINSPSRLWVPSQKPTEISPSSQSSLQ